MAHPYATAEYNGVSIIEDADDDGGTTGDCCYLLTPDRDAAETALRAWYHDIGLTLDEEFISADLRPFTYDGQPAHAFDY